MNVHEGQKVHEIFTLDNFPFWYDELEWFRVLIYADTTINPCRQSQATTANVMLLS